MSWEEVARTNFQHQREDIDLFIESVSKAAIEYERDRKLVKYFHPLKARDQLKTILPPLRKFNEKLAALESGSRSLTKLLMWDNKEMSYEQFGDEFDDFLALLDRWTGEFEEAYKLLNTHEAFKKDKNPNTYARLKFQKSIFIYYMAAFSLNSPPTYGDIKFREVFEAILESKGLPRENIPQTFQEILGYFRMR